MGMTAVFLEKLLFMQAQVVSITQKHKAIFSGCVRECSLSCGPLFLLLSGNYSLCQNFSLALNCWVFLTVMLLWSVMHCRQALLSCLRGGCISPSVCVPGGKVYAIDKLLWRQQRAFVAGVCHYPPSVGGSSVGWALPPLCFEFQAFILPTFPGLLALSPVAAAKRNAASEQKDAEAFWLGVSGLFQ